MYKIENILITGGAGYIGSHIVINALERGYKTTVFDDLSTGSVKNINKKAKFINGDIKDKKKLIKIIKDNKIDTIIHLAAFLNVKESEKNKKKYYNNNINGTLNLILACKDSTVKNIVFSSSCSVYGNVKGPVNEKKRLNPLP